MDEQHAVSALVSQASYSVAENEEPPSSGPALRGIRHPFWAQIPNSQWEDWRWQRQHSVRTTAQLAELLPLSADEITALSALEHKYRMAIPPYYFSLIDVDNPLDPIRLQAVPSPLEDAAPENTLDDPLEEDQDSPVPGLTHRYPDRALLITTPVCSMYCRFCTRKRVTMDREGWDGPSRDEERMIEYVQATPAIHDVIVSGGDPLTLPVAKLKWFVENLAAIPHLDVIRIGTRVPVTLPQRLFDPELVRLLQSAGKIWIQTHFNHPVEITPEAERACRNLVNAGMPVSNHAVLLKGVNDSVETMRTLVRNLLRIKVRPYYLFHCDPVTGAGHFRTTIWKGMEIIEGLRGHVSGLGVPTYVVDGVYGAGKIPVMPNYLVSAAENAVVLRNYEGMLFRYAPDDQPGSNQPIETTGVSNLLSGTGGKLMPEGNPRMARRRKKAGETTPEAAVDDSAAAENGTAKDAGKRPTKPRASSAGTNGHKPAKPNGVKRRSDRPANGTKNGKPARNGNGNGHGRLEEQLTFLDDLPVITPEGLKTNPGRRRNGTNGKSK